LTSVSHQSRISELEVVYSITINPRFVLSAVPHVYPEAFVKVVESVTVTSPNCCLVTRNNIVLGKVRLKRDGTRAETRFPLSPKRTSPFILAGASAQSNAGSRGARISVSNAGYTMFRGSVRVLATQSIRQFPLHFPSRASQCAIRFQTHYTS
jgi:hypothetical protein